jgi:hypothetical protein
MSLTGTVWAPIGPSPMNEGGGNDNGLVTTIAVNPDNNKIIYLGSAQGGVWRSGDAGATWTPLFDKQASLGIGEPGGIAIDPNDTSTIFVGTSGRVGSAEPDTVSQPTAGLFKSRDGGASWVAVGSGFPAGNTGNAAQFKNQTINIIRVDPANSRVVYLASTSGVFISSDGGLNWTQATGISGANIDTRSLALDLSSPANARILHVGVASSGVFRSVDGGRTFTQTLSATTPVVQTALAGNSFTRVVVALAPPTSPANVNGVQVIYVTMGAGYGAATDPIGLFVSTDQGATWARQNATGLSGTTYGGYALDMAVDPASPGDGATDTIYVGCLGQFLSTDAGKNFAGFSVGHADTHVWTMVPKSGGSTVVYCGCDGGIFTNASGAWAGLNRNGLQTGLFYNIAITPDATASFTLGALQDNEIQTTKGAVSPAWNATFGGDGWDVAYDGAGVVYSAAGGPATSIFFSTNDGATFPAANNVTPPWTAVDTGGPNNAFLLNQLAADPSASGILYASGAQNLWQRQAGGTWRIIASLGNTGNVDVAPTNGNNVVIAAGNKVWVSTNALAATVGLPTGVTFTDITPGLPNRNIARAVFDPDDPTVIYAVINGFGGVPQNVFKTTVAAGSWTNISPALDLPCGAIALDGTTTPTTLYVGTDFGVIRSVNGGVSWSVLDDIHFPKAPVFDLAFNPQAGVLRAATYGRGVFEFKTPQGPAIAVGLEDALAFGVICSGPQYLTITVYNVGLANLIISSVQVLFGSSDFAVLPTPSTPVTVEPGEEIAFTVSFTPSVAGASETAIIRIASNDPTAPFVDVAATGSKGTGRLATAIADAGAFGNVCLGSFADELLTLSNSGICPLTIVNIVGSADFLAPGVLSYPLVVSSGGSIEVVVRFQPSTFGAKAGALTILSDDPTGPHVVAVSGIAPAPRANLIVANSGSFGDVCVGSFADQPLILTNSGKCTLSVTGISSSSGDFLVPEVLSYPVTIGPGDALPVPIRFKPLGFGSKTGTIAVTSDDPASPISVNVSGDAPSGKLAIAGSTTFGGVNACCCADRTLSVCNTGDCALRVTSVRFKRRSRHWRLLNNPFPGTLHPGSCLPVVVQYRANEKCPRPCELVIESDDPVTPVKFVEVLAYTVWDGCRKEGCEDCRKGDCDDCRKKDCDGHPCRQGYPCCDDDDDHDDDDR